MVLLTGSMASIFIKSLDTVQTVLNTAYPGRRSFQGGGNLKLLLNWAGSVVFPYGGVWLGNTNVCEAASIFSFFRCGL